MLQFLLAERLYFADNTYKRLRCILSGGEARMVGFDSALLVRKIGMVFACFAAIHAAVTSIRDWQTALALAAGYVLVSFVFCRARPAAAVVGFTAMLGICCGFTLLRESYGSILYHILLLTVALERGTSATKKAAVAIILVFLGSSFYAARVLDPAFVAGVIFNVLGFYALTYAAVHLHILIDKKYTDDTKMKDLIDQSNQHYYMALTDGLTGLYNHRAYKEKISTISNYVILVIDIDHFKRLNDTYGHAIGDKVLIKIANIIKLSVRQGDYAFRYGGEEFVIILPGASLQLGYSIAERLRIRIAQMEYAFGTARIPVTVSIGLTAKLPTMAGSIAFEQADQALYQAKQQGRNQVQCYGGRPDSSHYQVNCNY